MGIEFTQAFSFTNSGSTGNIGNQYVLLGNGSPASGTAFAVKSLVLTSSLAATPSGTNYSLATASSDDNTGTNRYNFYLTTAALSAATPVPIVTAPLPLIITQPYLVYNGYQQTGSILSGIIVYSQINIDNNLSNTFKKSTTLLASGTNTLLQPSTGSTTYFVANAIITNLDVTNSCTAQYVLLSPGTSTIVGYLSSVITIAAQAQSSLSFPLYLSPSGPYDLGVVIGGSSTSRRSYISYNTDQYA